MRMNAQIGEYDVDSIILDLGLDMNILTKHTWEMMGKRKLFLSPVQFHLENQAKISSIGQGPHLHVEVKGLKTYGDFNVIEIANNVNPYPMLLGIIWTIENLAFINFKESTMMFENRDTRVIYPLDPLEGQQYVEPVKDEVMGWWDNAYNVSKDYINPTTNGELGWKSINSTSSYYDEAL